MIVWRNIEIFTFYHFDSDPRFSPFLLYVRWKSGVTFVRRCFPADIEVYTNSDGVEILLVSGQVVVVAIVVVVAAATTTSANLHHDQKYHKTE